MSEFDLPMEVVAEIWNTAHHYGQVKHVHDLDAAIIRLVQEAEARGRAQAAAALAEYRAELKRCRKQLARALDMQRAER